MWAPYGPLHTADEAAYVFPRADPARGPRDVVYYCYYYYGIHPAHEMWCTTVLLYTTTSTAVLLQYYYENVRPAHEAAHGLSRAETRAGPCITCTKKSRRRAICCCDDVFSRAELLVHSTSR